MKSVIESRDFRNFSVTNICCSGCDESGKHKSLSVTMYPYYNTFRYVVVSSSGRDETWDTFAKAVEYYNML